MFSILIPTFNNFEYLKLCLLSIKKNSSKNHEIIIHVNEGSDGTLEYVKSGNLKYTFSNCINKYIKSKKRLILLIKLKDNKQKK